MSTNLKLYSNSSCPFSHSSKLLSEREIINSGKNSLRTKNLMFNPQNPSTFHQMPSTTIGVQQLQEGNIIPIPLEILPPYNIPIPPLPKRSSMRQRKIQSKKLDNLNLNENKQLFQKNFIGENDLINSLGGSFKSPSLRNFCQQSEESTETPTFIFTNLSRHSSANSTNPNQSHLLQFSPPLNGSLTTLHNRSLSSPDFFRLSVPYKFGCVNPYGSSSSSMLSSPIPTNGDLSTVPLLFRYPPARSRIKEKSSSSNESLKHDRLKRKRDSEGNRNEVEENLNSINKMSLNLQKPQVQLNGSILSIGNTQLMESANKLMEQYSTSTNHLRHQSIGSIHSDSKRNLLLLQNVGRTLQRTHSHLKKTRLLHAFYLLALPVYTVIGAFIFQALDGTHDDNLMQQYAKRCQQQRQERLEEIHSGCLKFAAEVCFTQMRDLLNEVEACYRSWHETNKQMTHPMSDFTNAIIYAFSVYTTIGYGTISASTVSARIATVIYGAFGIPLFFAFIKEEGNQCRMCFIWVYNRVKEWQKKHFKSKLIDFKRFSKNGVLGSKKSKIINREATEKPPKLKEVEKPNTTTMAVNMDTPLIDSNSIAKPVSSLENSNSINNSPSFKRNFSKKGDNEAYTRGNYKECRNQKCRDNGRENRDRDNNNTNNRPTTQQRLSCAVREQRRVFISGVIIFILYLLTVSGLFAIMTGWDYFTAFYFLFNSVALIGFGDVFPSQSSIILVNMFFIVMGVVLFSMCYFILQEEIRVKAFEASRRARRSISKYSHSLMLHTKNPWSRRNSPAFDDRHSPYAGSGGSAGGGSAGFSGSAFDRLRKRRQSAPAITLDEGTIKELQQKANVASKEELCT